MFLTAPSLAHAGFQPDLLVKLATEPDGAYLGAGVFESTAQLQSKSQPAFPGTPALFRVLVKNAGDQPDTILLQGTGTLSGTEIRFIDSDGVDRTAQLGAGFATPQLAPGESRSYLVQVTPTLFQLGASFRVSVQGTSLGDGSKLDQVKTETVACSSTAAVILSTPPDGFGPPGSVVNYPYTLTNVGNTTNSYTLSVSAPSGWNSALFADDGAGGGVAADAVRQAGETAPVTATGTLAPGTSFPFFLAVTIPSESSDGAHGDTQISVTGFGTTAADQVTTSAVNASILVSEAVRNLTTGGAFAANANVLPGELLEYRMAVTNAGTLPASSVNLTSPLPGNSSAVPGTLRIATSPSGDGPPCAAALCGTVQGAEGNLVARLGEGTTDSSGGTLQPGKTLYVFFRVQVE
ncbi:hypothetical protein GMLC_06100 [Geomonas limicola]|uniref:DUF11 domain-containing protein n=1 Tax=Geomonas limicola TaxID=2740186 RepID=A0A6V8N3K4_9BACT|nr:DUF11 domain-containing protein [Geomonas limicola]GFO67031.1 hypothetical protein GMLC_06100 [Geomonas limicola]